MGAVYCAGQGKVRFLQTARSAAVEFHLSPAEPSGHLEKCRKETRLNLSFPSGMWTTRHLRCRRLTRTEAHSNVSWSKFKVWSGQSRSPAPAAGVDLLLCLQQVRSATTPRAQIQLWTLRSIIGGDLGDCEPESERKQLKTLTLSSSSGLKG